MIRRNAADDWLLLSQIDHAVLSADLAAAWTDEVTAFALPAPDWLLYAIRHHDDGWQPWTTAPEIDPETGIPFSFTEMPMATATQMWSASVDVCGRYNEWAALWVNLHFCWLANRALENRPDADEERSVLIDFLKRRREHQHNWFINQPREIVYDEKRRYRKGPLTISGFRALQFFDRLSLWLCINSVENSPENKSPQLKLSLGEASKFEFCMTTSNTVSVKPYPFCQPSLQVTAPARRVAQQKFVDNQSFQQTYASAPVEQLTWTFITAE